MARAKPKVEQEDTSEDLVENQELDILELDENLSDVPEPELMPPSWYLAEIQTVEVRQNQAGTGRYYSVKFVVPTDKYPADYDVENYPDGMPLYYNLVRVPRPGDRRAIANLRKFLEQIGMPTNVSTIDPNEWIGRHAKVKVIHSKYQGVTREQIAPNGIQAAD